MTFFLDSNIVLYALSADEHKHKIAHRLLSGSPTISTQVINECSHVLRRKQHLSLTDVRIQMDARIGDKYGYSHFDSLIIASALGACCKILYSEDMQNGQLIEHSLTIINPFIAEHL